MAVKILIPLVSVAAFVGTVAYGITQIFNHIATALSTLM